MQNANSKWQEAETMELSQIDRYKTFLDLGKKETPTWLQMDLGAYGVWYETWWVP